MLERTSNAAATAKSSGDFYRMIDLLPPADRALVEEVRRFGEEQVQPVINDQWSRDAFPHALVPHYAALGIAGVGYEGYGCGGRGSLLDGFVMKELARVDCSIATFHAVHSGLAMGSVYLCGSDEQKRRWLPRMQTCEAVGAFALTEPEVGSGAARGLITTARRDRDGWVIDGRKRWVGNATFADVTVVWARDAEDGDVKGFLVERGTTGFGPTKMAGKTALRALENADIALDGCRVPDGNRLPLARSFRDTARVLRMTRVGVAWEAVGCQQGAYEHALRYARDRKQFGRPIGGFQLVQDMLARMLGNVTATLCMVMRLSQLQDAGVMDDEQASLAKVFCTSKMRETVGLARELMGGNGILLDNNVARFVADAEAIYSYEGTREINSLVVGRAITGLGAFV